MNLINRKNKIEIKINKKEPLNFNKKKASNQEKRE